MPKELVEKLAWLFLLLPGFMCISVVGMIVDLGELSEFQITYYSLIATLPIVILTIPGSAAIGWALKKLGFVASGSSPAYVFFVTSFVIALAIGLVAGLTAQGDEFYRTLRSLPGTDVLNKRSSKRPLVFLLNQNSKGQMKKEGDGRPVFMKRTEAYARVELKEGPIYEGWPEFYEHGNSPSELYLSPACRVSTTGEVSILPGPGVIIVEAEIKSIELLDRESSACFGKYAELVQKEQAKPR